ncbi:MAG: TonB-dependent receptor, partial [Chthoniobacterales bacterium]|nr:TonB-dependent receptor [Chthoniobacterales bacterium]
ADIFHKKTIIVERGSFRPVTYATNDMLDGARADVLRQTGVTEEDLVVVMEMTLENLLSEGQLDHADFLGRVDILGSLGRTVLISKFGEYYRLAAYLSRYTNNMIALAMGVPSLQEIFDEKYYLNLEGGILEALGRMFKSGLKLFVYPMENEETGRLITAKQLEVAPNLHHLYQYLIENSFIQEISNYHREYLKIFPPDVLAKMQKGDRSWETMVPPEVAQVIKEREFFGYRRTAA